MTKNILSFILLMLVGFNSMVAQPPPEPIKAMNAEQIEALSEQVTQIDVIYLVSSTTLELQNKNTKIVMSFVEDELAQDLSCTNASAMLMFLAEGEEIMQAEVFVHEGCHYLKFKDLQHKFYVNRLSKEGIAFFKQYIENK